MKANHIVFFRFLIVSILLVAGLMANAQPDPWGPDTTQTPPELESYDVLLDYVYGDLTEYLNNSILIDRAGTEADKSMFTSKTPDAAATKYDYYMVYTEMAESQIPRGEPMTILDIDSAATALYSEDDVVTISMLNCEYSSISEQAKELDGVYWDGYQLRILDHDVSYDLFNEDRIFALMPLTEAVTLDGNVTFQIPEEFVFNLGENYNPEQELDISLEINFDDGMGFREVFIGQEFEIYYDQMGDKIWNYRALVDGEHFYFGLSEFSLRKGDPVFSYDCGSGIVVKNNVAFRDEPQEIISLSTEAVIENPANKDPNVVNGKMGIYFGCGNTDCEIKRPFIFVTGFGPDPRVSPKKQLISKNASGMFYHHFNGVFGQQADTNQNQSADDNNGTNLLYRLRNEGYDIIILDFENGVDYIQNHAALIERAIKNVNYITKLNGSKHETMILGQSQGGVSTRYALADWERKYMQEDSEPYMHHRCRSWFSWEGEMQGATIPLGLQLSTWYLTDRLPIGLATAFFGVDAGLGSMAVSNYLHFGVLNKALNNPAAKSLLTYHFSNNRANNDVITNKHPYHLQLQLELATLGYPEQLRRIAVANGPSRAQPPVGVDLNGGDCMLDLKYRNNSGSWGRMRMQTEMVGQIQEVFRGRFRIAGIPVPGMHKTGKKNYAKAESIAPGSFERFYQGIFHKMTPINKGDWTGSCALDDYRVPFVPTTTVFDIQDDYSVDYGYDMVANDLFWIDDIYPSTSHGYPHIKNKQYKTPFHALYASEEPEFHNQNPQIGLANFILLESKKIALEVQNRVLIGRPGETYTAIFEARDSITTGRSITKITKEGVVMLGQFSDVDFIAPRMHFRDGFHAQYGSKLSVRSMNQLPDPCFQFNDQSKRSADNIVLISSNEYEENMESSHVFPNPSRGLIKLKLDESQQANIQIFDFSGRLIYQNQFYDDKFNIDLRNVSKGEYFIRIISEDKVEHHKFILI